MKEAPNTNFEAYTEILGSLNERAEQPRGQNTQQFRPENTQAPIKDEREKRLEEIRQQIYDSLTPEEREWRKEREEQWKEWREGKRKAPPGQKKIVLDPGYYMFIDTPEEKARKRAEIPQEEYKRLRGIVDNPTYSFTDNEWEALDSRWFGQFFDTLDQKEMLSLIYKREYLTQAKSRHREKKLMDWIEERKDHYPSWWEVYDKNGTRILKMSPMDKALLAKWRNFDKLPPEMQYEELKKWTETNIKKDEAPGEKFAKFIDGLLTFLLALFGVEDDRGQQAQKPV